MAQESILLAARGRKRRSLREIADTKNRVPALSRLLENRGSRNLCTRISKLGVSISQGPSRSRNKPRRSAPWGILLPAIKNMKRTRGIFDRRRASRSLAFGALFFVCLMATGYVWRGARGAVDPLLRPGFAPFLWYYGGILELGFFGLLGYVFDVALYAIAFYGLLTLRDYLVQPAATSRLHTEVQVPLPAPLRRSWAGRLEIFQWKRVCRAIALEMLFLIFLMAASAKWAWPYRLLLRPQPWSWPVLWLVAGANAKKLPVFILSWNVVLFGLISYVLATVGDYMARKTFPGAG